jgi:flagellar protein FliO/FliZ
MDVINLLHYLLALIFVLAMVMAALLVKRYGSNPAAFKAGLGAKWGARLGKWDFAAPERRLAVVESLILGPKQRLLLIRRDNVEHLVLTGPDGADVIETGIAPKVAAP